MAHRLRLGMIGLDTSHVTAFTELLHDKDHRFHVPGGKVVAAYPGGSPDFPLSCNRVDGFTEELRDKFGVDIVDSPGAVAEQSDAIFLESVDGRVHLKQFEQIVRYGKPIFVDKPFALSTDDARAMVSLAREHGTPIMSCSALRFSDALVSALRDDKHGSIIGCDTYGPMGLEPTQPGLFWYGIHCVEVLFSALGMDCVHVMATSNDDYDEVVGVWSDGRVGTIRGNRKGNYQFGALIHREKATCFVDISGCEKPYYASLLERVMELFRTRETAIDCEETQQIIRFIECANQSRDSGEPVELT